MSNYATKVLEAIRELDIEASRYEDRDVWRAIIEDDVYLTVVAEDEKVVHVFVAANAENKEARHALIDFMSMYDAARRDAHTHLEYDHNMGTYRMVAHVIYGKTEDTLSVAMIRGMIVRCINEFKLVLPFLRNVEVGGLNPREALDAYFAMRNQDEVDESLSEEFVEEGSQLDGEMRLRYVLRQWLKLNGRDDHVEIYKDKTSASFTMNVADVELTAFIETFENVQWCKFFYYMMGNRIPENRLFEVKSYLAKINTLPLIGHLQLLEDDRLIRFYSSIAVEDASFEPNHIGNLLNNAIFRMEMVVPQIMAISFGDKSAQEILDINE